MELLKFLLRIERRRLQLTVHKRHTQPNITRFPRYGVKIERVGCKRRELNGYHNIKRDLNIQTPVTFCSAVYPWIDPWSLPWSIARSAGGRNLANQKGSVPCYQTSREYQWSNIIPFLSMLVPPISSGGTPCRRRWTFWWTRPTIRWNDGLASS